MEKIYGSDAIVTVKPEIPFSFALAMDSSLTQKKATHVKTIHYGLRRLYREAAAWWHESTAAEDLFLDSNNRQFPCPLGNKRDAPNDFTMVLAGDFSIGNVNIQSLLEEVKTKSKQSSLALFHWPDYRQFPNDKIASEVFELCVLENLAFTHSGHELSAEKFMLFDSGLADWPPDELPKIRCLQEVLVISVNGQAQKIDANSLKERLTN